VRRDAAVGRQIARGERVDGVEDFVTEHDYLVIESSGHWIGQMN
jgi:hypothetical protein